MFRENLLRVYQTLIKGGRKPRPRRVPRTSRPAAARLGVECLEDRTLLSTLSLGGIGNLVYEPSISVANTLSISHDSATHRYTFVDMNEAIILVGGFISPSGNGTNTVSFGDGNLNSILVDATNANFTVNIEQTLAFVPVTVNLGNDNDTVNVSPTNRNLDNIQGAIIINGSLINSYVNISDQANAAAQSFSIGAGSVSRSGAAAITYASIGYLTSYAGDGNNTYDVSGLALITNLNTGNGQDTVNVNGTVGGSLQVVEGAAPLPGSDTANVRATNGPVDIIGHGLNTVNVGNAGSVQAINGDLTISDPPSFATINVYDYADAIPRTVNLDTVTIGGASFGSITGLGSAPIRYKYEDTNAVTIAGGTGNDTFNLNPTGASDSSLTVDGGGGNDTFNITPNLHVVFTVHGGTPRPATSPAGTLNLNLAGVTNPQLTLVTPTPPTGLAGTWTFGNCWPVNFDGMQSVPGAVADLALTNQAAASVAEGSNLTYTITVHNNGPSDAANVVITDALPANASFVSANFGGASVTVANNTVIVNLGTVANGATVQGTIVLTAVEEGSLVNTASVSSAASDPILSNNSQTANATVADVAVAGTSASVSAPAGGPFSGAVATFTDPAGAEATADYTASINWGDSSPATMGTITLGGGTYTVSGSHTYINPGNLTITTTINHEGIITVVTSPVMVADLGPAQPNEVGGIAFWIGSHGQGLIRSFNGGANATALGNWLASNFPNLYGASAGSHNLTGDTNTQVAAFLEGVYASSSSPSPLDAEVLATALNVYATTLSLGGTAGQAFGFQVDTAGLGARTANVGTSGMAFGVANFTNENVLQLLKAANAHTVGGEPWGMNLFLRTQALFVFDSLNEMGTIS